MNSYDETGPAGGRRTAIVTTNSLSGCIGTEFCGRKQFNQGFPMPADCNFLRQNKLLL